jgi:AcrR family transcriptional regulator
MNKPRGRESVRQALIDAGIKLFAERGPDDVSVRELAAHAGVNHGLVHRHFGSKDGLLQATMAQLADKVADSVGPANPSESLAELLRTTFGATEEATHWRILARSLLDGIPIAELQDDFPVVRRMLAAAGRGVSSPLTSQSLVTLLLAGGLGLLLFEPYLREATGQQEDSQWQTTRKELAALAMRTATPAQSTKK